MKKILTLTVTLLTLAISVQAQIVITEIMYNNPGTDDYEYIELYNNSMSAVDMTGWTMGGVTYTFSGTLNAGEYIVLCQNPTLIDAAFGITSTAWDSGAVNNSGETITLSDANGNLIDEVTYDDAAPWPTSPDGDGFTLVLCDVNSDNNDAANWSAASTPTGFEIGGVPIFANPGAASQCSDDPFVGFASNAISIAENAGVVAITISLNNGNGMATTVDVNVGAASTATDGSDYSYTAQTVTFPANMPTAEETITVSIIDDSDEEISETIVLELSNPSNNATLLNSTYTITIQDNDATIDSDLLITGVFDAQPAASGTKGFELQAINNIADLSLYGVESANNGGGASGAEFVFPNISLDAGDCIYVVDDSTKFADFFGFNADFVNSAANINGDDAIVLYKGDEIVDVCGDPNVDGTNEPWESMDGWAYRVSGTGPDGSSFNLSNWTFSGINALDGAATNNDAMPAFPTCTYMNVVSMDVVANDDNAVTNEGEAIDIFVLNNDNLPNDWTSLEIIDLPSNGSAVVNLDASITYTPEDDFCDDIDSFEYEVCDGLTCDTAVVMITVNCPLSYPPYDIGTVTTVNMDGLPDSINTSCQIQGIVHGVDLQGGVAIQFTLIDATGGVSVFSPSDLGYTVNEGDQLIIQGIIGHFNGLTQMTANIIIFGSSGNPTVTPPVVTELNESTESELIRIDGLTVVDPGQWTNTGSGFTVDVTDGVNTYQMRIDNDVDIFGSNAPSASFSAIGIGSQFDNSLPHDEGYQFLPRYMPDLIFGFSANNDAVSTDQNTSVTFDPTSNDNLPDGFDTFTIISGPDEGSIDVMGSSITYIPNMDYCGNDEIVYEICKNMDCDQGTIAISVVCDSGYPLYDIATITTVNADGLPDSLGVSCQLQGIVYGVDLQGANDNIQFYFIDGTGGTSLFANTDFGYTVQEGDEIIVQGTITQFNCLAQITPDTLWLISTGNDLVAPTVVTTLDESTEGELIMIENLTLVDPGQWNPGGSGFNVDVTNGNDTYQMRIDNDVNLFGASAPSTPFNAIGLGGQFDNSAPCDDGYQFLPRYEEDIIFLDATIDKSLSQKIQFFPNPTDGMLNIRSDIQLDRVIIFNLLGQKMLESQNLDNQIEVYNFPAGIYTITFVSGDSFWVTEFVKR
ncbi:MAG: lamin tail domain-containing protein [Saprospiraceae bacterium]|jgi:hypothetical protein|nr:lamin tail domain-containing protein [Saprospiraceae bacterium]